MNEHMNILGNIQVRHVCFERRTLQRADIVVFAVLIRTLSYIVSIYMFLHYGKIMNDIKKSTTELCRSTVSFKPFNHMQQLRVRMFASLHGSCQAFCVKSVLLVTPA